MKRVFLAFFLSIFMIFWSMGSFAANDEPVIAVIDMDKIFRTSPEVNKINESLKSQFTDKKKKIDEMTKALQEDVKKYEKDKAVTDEKTLAATAAKLEERRKELQQVDMQFQKDFMAAQNEKSTKFLDKIKEAVAQVATNKKIQVVVPKRALLYSKDNLDITDDVLKNLK